MGWLRFRTEIKKNFTNFPLFVWVVRNKNRSGSQNWLTKLSIIIDSLVFKVLVMPNFPNKYIDFIAIILTNVPIPCVMYICVFNLAIFVIFHRTPRSFTCTNMYIRFTCQALIILVRRSLDYCCILNTQINRQLLHRHLRRIIA